MDPLQSERGAFTAAEAHARALLKPDPAAADVEAQKLVVSAEKLGPSYLQRALGLRVESARARRDFAAQWVLAWQWLKSCGPDGVDRCRSRAIAELQRAAPKSAHPAQAKKQLADLRSADACLKQAELSARSHRPAPGCLASAEQHYRRFGDRLMVARCELARGDSFERAESACDEPRCLQIRRAALKAQIAERLGRGEAEQAARAAFREMALYSQTLPAPQQAYAWTQQATRSCAAYEKKAGSGACRKLERSVLGRWFFRDFSRDSAGEGLSPEAVRAVNDHFGVTLQDCLSEQARRITPPSQERYTVRWVVLNEGRVGEVHLNRKELDQGPLAQCLRQRLAVWRYPRYRGEFQHVEQTFVVSASTWSR